jgi:integrase
MVARAHGAAGRGGPFLVKDAIDYYLQWYEPNRKSFYDVQRRIEAFILPQLGHLQCDELTPDILRKWHAGLAKQPPRVRTAAGQKQNYRAIGNGEEEVRKRRTSANKVLTILKAALNLSWREGKIKSDDAWRRVEPFKSVSAARIRYLTVDEAKRLINACTPGFRPLVQAALATGARYGELGSLQVHDFNVDAGTLAVRQSKTGRSRHIVLTEEGIHLFQRLAAGRTGEDLLLPKTGGGPYRKSDQLKPMIAVCERAKIHPRISFHILRHTWASLSVMGGVPLMVVAKNLGHADTKMVEKHYGHLAPSYITDEIRKGAPKFGFKPDQKVQAIRVR